MEYKNIYSWDGKQQRQIHSSFFFWVWFFVYLISLISSVDFTTCKLEVKFKNTMPHV